MIRTLGRVLAVLLIAGIVSAGLYALSVTPAVQAMIPTRGGPPEGDAIERRDGRVVYDGKIHADSSRDKREFHRHRGEEYENHEEQGLDEHEDHDEDGSLIEALPGMAAHMGMILLVVALVFILQKGLGFIRRS